MVYKMRRHFLLLILFRFSFIASAQTFLWPIAGHSAGENILSKPQEYILPHSGDILNGELNFSELFIGGKEGTPVLCPTEGIIQFIGIDYLHSLEYMVGYQFDPALTVDENIKAVTPNVAEDPRYLTCAITLRLADGTKLHLSGIAGNRRFKTGQRVSAGDTLGTMAYAYHALHEPSVLVSRSDSKGRVLDPMSPFGIPSTFIEPRALTRDNPLPAEKAQEDLTVLEEAFCELYPSLNRRMPEVEFRAFIDSLKRTITGPVDPAVQMRSLIREVLHKVPDSHLHLFPDPVQSDLGDAWTPGEFLIWCDDTVRVLFTSPGYIPLEGKVVTRINGEAAAIYAQHALQFISCYDDRVESTLQEETLLLGQYGFLMNPHGDKDSVHELELLDGTRTSVPFFLQNRFRANETSRRIQHWSGINAMKHADDVFETQILNDSTAYLAIRTFEMLTAQVDQVCAFLDTCRTANLIVDVRNNAGGSEEVLMRILSCLTDRPMDRQKGGYNRVNKRNGFASLAYSLNYPPSMELFPEYEEGEDGFYLRDTLETLSVVMPDSRIRYSGKVYVLTNGHSFSAATLFPAVLVRNRRGVSVGRETGSGYHYMSALKFADIRLPHSLQTVRIPMVQTVFDDTVCERVPEGRGLMPDYPLPLTYLEVTGGSDGETDVMLEYALSLIAEGKYLSSEDPFSQIDMTPSKKRTCGLFFTLAAVLVIAFAIILRQRRTHRRVQT